MIGTITSCSSYKNKLKHLERLRMLEQIRVWEEKQKCNQTGFINNSLAVLKDQLKLALIKFQNNFMYSRQRVYE